MVISGIFSKIKQKLPRVLSHRKYQHYKNLQSSSHNRLIEKLEFMGVLENKLVSPSIDAMLSSTSQVQQDLLVLALLNNKKNGYFVDFGATDGYVLSNSFLLEKNYSWKGICAEPAKTWHDELKKRRSCHLEFSCVYSHSGETVTFNEALSPELSTIEKFSGSDLHASAREQGKKYSVPTISLVDLLKKYNAPHDIDYLSIDTEGSEFDILKNHDFEQYRFKIITVEHNGTNNRKHIYDLLKTILASLKSGLNLMTGTSITHSLEI